MRERVLGVLAASLLMLGASAASGPKHEARIGFQTGPASADPEALVRDHLTWNRARLGFAPGDLADLRVRDRYRTQRIGATHLYLRQRLRGIEVSNADLTVTAAADGRLLLARDRLVRGLEGKVNETRPALTPRDAIELAAVQLGLASDGPRVLDVDGGPARAQRWSDPGASLDPIPVKLMYRPRESGDVRLVWDLVLRPPGGGHWWDVQVDAVTGAILALYDWTAYESYRVFPLPLESPDWGPRTLIAEPADAIASPFGWHDTDGSPGADFTDTTGNNAVAQEDGDGDDYGGFAPAGGPSLVFDFPLDLTHDPNDFQPAAIANLYYGTNVLHDLHYHYGFDEAAGNFQYDNYGSGGAGLDLVIVDAQDPSVADNARMTTPPDGLSPRMELGIWDSSKLDVLTPPAIAGTKPAGRAVFGPVLTPGGLTGPVVAALDPANGAGPSTTDACSPLTNPGTVAGKIALIDRGTCGFAVKVAYAQAAGAIGVIMVNNLGNGTIDMTGDDPAISIPSVLVGQSNGNAIRAQLAAGVNAVLRGYVRDSAVDSGIMIHEYGHGVSNRLTGGPSNSNCLQELQSAGMGEGWSDWWALALTAYAGDAGDDPRGFGAYVSGESADSAGIRRFPYSTDGSVNPLSYGDITGSGEEHDVGEIWASALWQLYWNLVGPFGFDPDLYGGSGGNQLALELVIDALKLQPCNPSLLEGRDAILQADLLANGFAHRCRIWDAFARRGMGESADDGGSASSQSVIEAFDVPAECRRCGDVNDDGNIDALDLAVAGRALALHGPPLVAPEKCNTTGPTSPGDADSNGLPDDCEVADLAALRQTLAGLSPGISAVCEPAVGLTP